MLRTISAKGISYKHRAEYKEDWEYPIHCWYPSTGQNDRTVFFIGVSGAEGDELWYSEIHVLHDLPLFERYQFAVW